jgi:hypothetical protein
MVCQVANPFSPGCTVLGTSDQSTDWKGITDGFIGLCYLFRVSKQFLAAKNSRQKAQRL